MKKMMVIVSLVIIATASVMTGCTANQRAKHWGGTMNINLPKGTKFVNVTWKDGEMWYLTRPMTSTDIQEIYTFQEKSQFGMVQGKVVFIEQK